MLNKVTYHLLGGLFLGATLMGLSSPALAQQTDPAAGPLINSTVGGGVTVRPFDFNDQGFGSGDIDPDANLPDYVLTLRSHELSGKYTDMTQSLAKLIAYVTNGQIIVQTEAGLNSRENMQQSAMRNDLFFFTALARDVATLRIGTEQWGVDHPYQTVRSVVSLPPLVLQIITQSTGRARTLRDMAGSQIFAEAEGTTSHRLFTNAVDMLRLRNRIDVLPQVTGDDPLLALRRGEIDGYAFAAPLPNQAVQELSRIVQLGVAGYPQRDHQNLLEGEPQLIRALIPPHTYANVEFEVETVAEPVGIYTQERMLPEVVVPLTQAYWLWRMALIDGAAQPWWADTDPGDIITLQAPLHAASLGYYDGAGVILPEAQRPRLPN